MNERFGRKGTQLELAGIRGTIAEGHLAILQADQAAVADGDAENIGRQVLQSCAAIAYRFAVNDPFLLPDLRRYLCEKGGLLQGLPELAAEDFGERLYWQQKILPGS